MTRSRTTTLSLLLGLFLAPLALSAQVGRPETHTVDRGDTLWDLARRYLGDPFLWPEIYRLNTDVVEDPHWIYPGEVLRLAASAEISAVPSQDTPPPVAPPPVEAEPGQDDTAAAAPDDQMAAAPDDQAEPALTEPHVMELEPEPSYNRDSVDLTPLVGNNRRVSQQGPSLELALRNAYRPIRRSEFYSSGFLTENQKLPFGEVLGLVTPLQIEEISTRSTAQMYSHLAIKPPTGGSYQVGDTLMLARIAGEVEGHGDAVVPTGLARVLDVSRPEVLVEVIAAYGPIRDQQVALPAEKFTDPGNVRPVPISDGVRGAVLAHRDRQPLTGPQDVIFLDRGRADGVALGDLFELRQRPREREDQATVVNEIMATVQVVHVGESTATARVISVTQPNIYPGTEARQVAKLPS